MGEGVSTDNIMEGSQPVALTDLDFMDQLLSEGFWLQKTDGSEFMAPSPFTSNLLFDPSLSWPAFEEPEAIDGPSNGTGVNKQKALSHENTNYSFDGNSINASCSFVPSMDCSNEASDLCRRWWIGPTTASTSSMDRLIRALYYIKDCLSDKDVLIQVWVPVNKGNRRVLTTSHQPFLLNLNCARLAGYRDASVNYKFTAEEGEEEFRGLPGRVFAGKVPEWTPDVQFFRKDEYLRVGHAQQLDIHGTFGVPVFEQRDHNCLGVIEVVFITRKIKYHLELESVCKALEAVDLRCSSSSTIQNVKAYECSYQTTLPKITEILRAVGEKHSLSLVQVWASCIRQRKEGSRHTNENLIHCVSPVDSVFFIGDPSVQGFHEACSEHHLFKGEGIVGRAFVTNQLCFSPDVTSFTKIEYPLSHYARMFGLRAAVAIPMQNTCAESTEFVLELFLPIDCNDPEEHGKMITSLYAVIQKVSWSVCDISYRELKEKPVVPVVVVSEVMPEMEGILSHDSLEEAMNDVCKASKGNNRKLSKSFAKKSPESRPNYTTAAASREKRRAKTEKAVTLEILQQYFAGSLKDAAKSIGVCPTTLKRICREHGIKRWPSRKLKKVSHSIRKIQRVMDSVQGQSGTLPVESFYCNFLGLDLPYLSKLQPNDPSKLLQMSAVDVDVDIVSKSSTSSSSCSQNSKSREHGLAPGPLNDSWQQHLSCNEEGPKVLDSTNNNVSRSYRLKVTFGEEKIRFRMQREWGYGDLMREIGTRFGIIDTNGFLIKYFDDDLEWVLLTCDDDLEECIHVFQSSGNQILRLTFVHDFP